MQASRDVQSQPIKRMCYSKEVSLCEGCFCHPLARGPASEETATVLRPPTLGQCLQLLSLGPEEPENGENRLSGTPRPPPVQTSVTCPHFSLPGVARELRPPPGASCPRHPRVSAASAVWLETPFLLLCCVGGPDSSGGSYPVRGPLNSAGALGFVGPSGLPDPGLHRYKPRSLAQGHHVYIIYAFPYFTAPLSGRPSFSS